MVQLERVNLWLVTAIIGEIVAMFLVFLLDCKINGNWSSCEAFASAAG